MVDLKWLFVLLCVRVWIWIWISFGNGRGGERAYHIARQFPIFTTNVPGIGSARTHCPLLLRTCRPGTVPCDRMVTHS